MRHFGQLYIGSNLVLLCLQWAQQVHSVQTVWTLYQCWYVRVGAIVSHFWRMACEINVWFFSMRATSSPFSSCRRHIHMYCMYVCTTNVFELVHSWNTGGEPELISVLHTDAQLQRSCPQCNLHVAWAYNVHSVTQTKATSRRCALSASYRAYSIATGSSTPTLSTQQASLNLCAKSCPSFSSRFLEAVEDFVDMRRVQHVQYIFCAAMGVADMHVRYVNRRVLGNIEATNATRGHIDT